MLIMKRIRIKGISERFQCHLFQKMGINRAIQRIKRKNARSNGLGKSRRSPSILAAMSLRRPTTTRSKTCLNSSSMRIGRLIGLR